MNNSHSTPTPPVDPRTATAIPAERRSRRNRVLFAGGLAAAVGIVSIGGQLVAAPSVDAAQKRSVQASDELAETTLGELAAELEDLGLVLQVEPAGDLDQTDDEADELDEADEADTDSSDPFAEYSDDEFDALSDEEFFQILDDAGMTIDDDGYIVPGDDDHGDDHDHDIDEEEVLGTFAVDGDTIDLSNAATPEVAEQAQEVWERFTQIIPADQREMLTSFELNSAEAGGGYVYPNDNPSTWSMGISLGLGEDLDYVLIHEFAHLLTLQAEEVPPAADDNPDACSTYFTGEGCALSGSTMAEFVQRFWPQSQLDEIRGLQEAEDYDGLDAFYRENADDFVTDYATTNPAEDLAETFTAFVLNNQPTGDTIADEKVNLLWADADMVELRDQIRASL